MMDAAAFESLPPYVALPRRKAIMVKINGKLLDRAAAAACLQNLADKHAELEAAMKALGWAE